MPELSVDTDWSYRGLRAVVLENRFLRAVILPEVGAKLWQITYKPLDADLLWNNPRIPPAWLPMNSRYDDVWSGGWDELFPNDEATAIDGEPFPDHGELWTGMWKAEPFSAADRVGVKLRFITPISSIQFEKTIALERSSRVLRFQHRLTNASNAPFSFLWKLHPAFAVTPAHCIDFPPMDVLTEPAFLGTLKDSPPQFRWPLVRNGDRELDLRRVPHSGERELHFFYGANLEQGWCSVTNVATGLACGLNFDTGVFRSAWLFASYGGWRNYNVAVLEPCTGYPLSFEALQAAGRARTLQPSESLETEVVFAVQEGMESVDGVDRDGNISGARVLR